MDWYRMKHTIGMYLCLTGSKRADYIRKHDIFSHMGQHSMTMFRTIPLHPKLISIGDNVWIASNVMLITHDVIHKMVNQKIGKSLFQENIGCIEIGNNCFIGSGTLILPNVRISSDTIVGAGSLVNKNLRGGYMSELRLNTYVQSKSFLRTELIFRRLLLNIRGEIYRKKRLRCVGNGSKKSMTAIDL